MNEKTEDPAYLNSKEYCAALGRALSTYLQKEHPANPGEADEFPWPVDALSDHRIVTMRATDGYPSLATWNVLNPKYLRHLNFVPSGDHQFLHKHAIANPGIERQCWRMTLIARKVARILQDIPLIMLQEVSHAQAAMIITQLQLQMYKNAEKAVRYKVFTTRESPVAPEDVNATDALYSNCNMYIWNCDRLFMIDSGVFYPATADRGDTRFLVFSTTDPIQTYQSGRHFAALNVHATYAEAPLLARALLAHEQLKKIMCVVGGDFNLGVRARPEGVGDEMRLQKVFPADEPRFRFPNVRGMSADVALSHVAKFNNIGRSFEHMAERFDHVVMMLPADGLNPNEVMWNANKNGTKIN